MLECLDCGAKFARRPDAPDMLLCVECLPDLEKIDDYRCPKCGWSSEVQWGEDNANVKYLNERQASYEYGGIAWDEEWTCLLCGTVFTFSNSSV